MGFPPSLLDEIRDRLPISAIVGRRVAWDKRKSQPAKGDFWACCPFHGEKTPSFHADDRRGRYHCFGCGASGDHFTFLIEREGLSFPEAVEQLAAEAGLALPERDADADRREAARASLYDVMEAAARFFEGALSGPDGGKARAYLRDRGLTPDIQKRFRIGYAPASRSALKEHLAGKGIAQEQMIEAGLLIAGDDMPVSYDRFRDRIIFPITDLRGRVIAFGGRALSPDAKAKYLNSPDTPLFHKGQMLFNGQAARAAARQGGHLIVVEGYTDAIACVAAGFEATVAPLGTALTEEQLALLWGMADEPILCFDGDEAGMRAAYRASRLAPPHLKLGKSLKFALLPQGRDPDDLIREAGAEGFRAVLEAAEPLSKFLLIRETEGLDLNTPEQRATLEDRLYQVAASIKDARISRHYRDFFRLRLSELFWTSDTAKAKGAANRFRREPPQIIEKIIVGLCVEEPWLFSEKHEELAGLHFQKEVYKKFMLGLERLLVENPNASVRDVYEGLGAEFYDVLEETHGMPAAIPSNVSQAVRSILERATGGHRLRMIFPALKLLPTQAVLSQTLAHFIILHKLKGFEDEIADDLKSDLEERIVATKLRALREFRESVAQSERELDAEYEKLRFRAAHDNSGGVGAAVLSESPRTWQEALGQ